ncbi:hypothetical protein KJ359_001710 [Pestalotiopsis sp. 9143b]|nr:hypothetical protein KJ359_001710 [Pestalotiopsis sp. 9143b]
MDDLGYGSTPIRQGLPVVVESLMSLAEGVLPMLETAVVTTGKGLNEYYVLVMAASYILGSLSFNPKRPQLWYRPKPDRFIRITPTTKLTTDLYMMQFAMKDNGFLQFRTILI